MTEQYICQHVIPVAYTLLPAFMNSTKATALLMAIGQQESKFIHRRQIGGPARGFLQFERGGINGVLTHAATKVHIANACSVLSYSATTDACHAAIEHNDVLAMIFGRLLLWTLPDALPDVGQAEVAWRQYYAAWRPGKVDGVPVTSKPPPMSAHWAQHFEQGWEFARA